MNTAPGTVVALDARDGKVRVTRSVSPSIRPGRSRWSKAKSSCGACAIREAVHSADDARTGEVVWSFQNVLRRPASRCSQWVLVDLVHDGFDLGLDGLPSTCVERGLGYRHRCAEHAHGNATTAILPARQRRLRPICTAIPLSLWIHPPENEWYYQHLPGDDWDQDYTNERVLFRTAINPDSRYVKWINPDVRKGEQHDVSVNVGEGGGIWALDRNTGQFLWANPFPYDNPNFLISDIEPKSGRVTINYDLVMKKPGDHHVICFWNTKSYWPMSYHPARIPCTCRSTTIACLRRREREDSVADHAGCADPEQHGQLRRQRQTIHRGSGRPRRPVVRLVASGRPPAGTEERPVRFRAAVGGGKTRPGF